MAKILFIFILLLIIFLIIVIFSINLEVVVSFFTSTSYDELYNYCLYVKGLPRKRKSSKKSSPKGNRNFSIIQKRIIDKLHNYAPYLEINNISILGSISFGAADLTAKACGMLYSLSGLFCGVLSLFSNKIQINKIAIQPIYEDDVYGEIFFECILKFNIGNIIVENLKDMKGLKKNVKSNK